MAKVLLVQMKVVRDTDPDLDFLGKYSNTPDAKRGYIDREERGDLQRGEFRYFNCGDGDPEYIKQDYQRMEAYQRGDWWMVGVRAVAKIEFKGGRMETIETPGLWGIESDSGDEHFKGVYAEELHTLKSMLAELGLELPRPAAAKVRA